MKSASANSLLASCRRIFLRDLEVLVSIGIHDFEKQARQRIIVNVDLYVPFAVSAAKTDSISDVVDYDFIRDVVARCIGKKHIALQETLCDGIVDTLLAHPKVVAARVSTEKPDVYPDCQAVGIEVFRRKAVDLVDGT